MAFPPFISLERGSVASAAASLASGGTSAIKPFKIKHL